MTCDIDAERLGILRDFAEAYNRHDVDAIMQFMTDDCTFISYFGPEAHGERFEGHERVRQRVASFLRDVPDARWENAYHFVSGDRGVSQWTYVGTRVGTNETIRRNGCDLFTFRDSKISIKDTFQKMQTAALARKELEVPSIYKPIGRYAHAVRFKDLLLISGCGPFDKDGALVGADDIAAQITRTFENIEAILNAAGMTFAHVLKETIYLTDVADGPATRPIREKFYGPTLPAATLIGISRCVNPDMKIEIEVVAGF